MDFEERQGLCYRIIAGYTIVTYDEKIYRVYDPIPVDYYESERIYSESYDNFCRKGYPTESEALATLSEKKLWDDNKDKQIQELELKIKTIKQDLPSLEFKSFDKAIALKKINEYQNTLDKLKKIKSSLLSDTAEHLSKLFKYKYLLYKLTKNVEGERVWKNFDEFTNSPEHFLNKLLTSSYFSDDINESKIREIARSDPWRAFWSTSLKSGNLFNKPAVEMTELQRVLCSWSIIYDSVFEHPECPNEEVINDDILLNQWLEDQSKERKKNKKNGDRKITNNDKISNASEVGVVVHTPEDARKVYELNDESTKALLSQRDKVIELKGEVKECELPDVQRNLRMEYNRMSSNYKKGKR